MEQKTGEILLSAVQSGAKAQLVGNHTESNVNNPPKISRSGAG
jgi:hypothetical protein